MVGPRLSLTEKRLDVEDPAVVRAWATSPKIQELANATDLGSHLGIYHLK